MGPPRAVTPLRPAGLWSFVTHPSTTHDWVAESSAANCLDAFDERADAVLAMATITTADVFQSNGVIHVIDTVLMP